MPLWVGLLALAALSAYLALFWGAFSLIFRVLESSFPSLLVLLAPAVWTALEWLRNYLLTGFPWGSLGYSQWRAFPLIQTSEWTGIYGTSFIVCAVNVLIYQAVKFRKVHRAGAISILLLLLLNFGAWRLERGREEFRQKAIKVAVLQGNIDQYKKWDQAFVDEIKESYKGLLEGMPPKSAGLIVWPETALPGWYPMEKHLTHWLNPLLSRSGAPHLFGAVTEEGRSSFNSAFLTAPDGKILGRYDKMHLVPFGEFVPMGRLFSSWIGVLNDLGGFDGGAPGQVLEADGLKLGAGICYESIFPEIPRAQVKKGAQVLFNLTNDGWYLQTAAPEQHFAMNIFRAVETRRYFVRAANTGISGIISPEGKILARTRLNERTVLEGSIFPRNDMTLFVLWGDWFPALCSILVVAALVIARSEATKQSRQKYENP